MRDLAILFADLDALVQKLCKKTNVEWVKDNSDDMREYRKLMSELAQALREKTDK